VGRRHAAATVQDFTWSAKLPANVDWSKVEMVSKKGEVQTVLKPGESEYSHRESLDKWIAPQHTSALIKTYRTINEPKG
jgi:hypothetical protein